MKRFRKPKIEAGELRIQWGRIDGGAPDLIFHYGEKTQKSDVRLLHYHLQCQHPDPQASPIFSVMRPSLIEELESRGYDITTLQFSIKKREPGA